MLLIRIVRRIMVDNRRPRRALFQAALRIRLFVSTCLKEITPPRELDASLQIGAWQSFSDLEQLGQGRGGSVKRRAASFGQTWSQRTRDLDGRPFKKAGLSSSELFRNEEKAQDQLVQIRKVES